MSLVFAGVCSHAPGIVGRKDRADPVLRDFDLTVAAGEVVCGTSLDLGRLRLDCAFLRWRMEGREGVGRYDILRRVG